MSVRAAFPYSVVAAVASLALLCGCWTSQARAEELENGEELSAGWLQTQELASPHSFGGHYGGVAVQGSIAVVTEPDVPESGGYAYVYERPSSGEWVEQARLQPPASGRSEDEPESFGQSVSISGSTLVISAWEHNKGKGVAYVYERSAGGTWGPEPTAKLTGSGEAEECFSYDVAIEGSTIVVGAPGYDEARGAAYVFTRSASANWTKQAILTKEAEPRDFIGESVALSGSTIIVGAPRLFRFAVLDENGVAYVYTRSADGTWSKNPSATLKAPAEATHEGLGNYFGFSVALNGSTALIGAFHAGGSKPPGAAFVFTDEAGTWVRKPELMAKKAEGGELFGFEVALSGSTALIGAYGHHEGTGTAYVFERSEAGEWSQQAKLIASDHAKGSYFGQYVALSGTTALVGADVPERAYVFTK